MGKLNILLAALITLCLILGTGCGSASQPSVANPQILSPPAVPSNLTAQAISSSAVSLWWSDNSSDELGFNIYRDGTSVGAVNANVNTFQDRGLNYATPYTYTAAAFNAAGESSQAVPASATTMNPTITITIYQVGVFETGESWLRGAPEQYIHIAADDGINKSIIRIPSRDEEYLSIERNQTKAVYETISFPEVGSYLRLYIVAYEKDSSDFEALVTQSLGSAALTAVTGGAGMGIESLFSGFLGQIIASLIGSEDDFLGSIERMWYQSQGWGAGNEYSLTDENLRVWFRISAQ
ncbi:MAG TPA: fibronectin type III domain-containing protein [Dehalococcoidia bacterium]|nr:fibronectin type III domain-containing protein [Dehalococcoidia bacterium]